MMKRNISRRVQPIFFILLLFSLLIFWGMQRRRGRFVRKSRDN